MKTLKPATMVKQITTAFTLLFSLAATAQKHHRHEAAAPPKFLTAIEITTGDPVPQQSMVTVSEHAAYTGPQAPKEQMLRDDAMIESATGLQLKYAVLLNTEVEAVQNEALFAAVDEWYGTRYELGGSTKSGIDCSAFVQAVYSKLFQIPMPRTAKEQSKAVRQISRTEMKQGDLVFFNTKGNGVSHVGIYLQNNKFVHAATSGGVMISDLFEEYWIKHFAGAGRAALTESLPALAAKP